MKVNRKTGRRLGFVKQSPTPFHLNGLLLVKKKAGPSSHDIVDMARKALGIKRIGHCGTLDPFASGILTLLLGEATRLQGHFLSMNKNYHAIFRFGRTSDTLDLSGELTDADASFKLPPQAEIEKTLEQYFKGSIQQVPPRFSAVKVQGKRAYQLARAGKEFQLQPKSVTIYSITAKRLSDTALEVKSEVSAGTYIRSLVRDLAEKFSGVGLLESLVRTNVGPFTIEECLDSDELSLENKVLVEESIKPLQLYIQGEHIALDDMAFKQLVQGSLFAMMPRRAFERTAQPALGSRSPSEYRLFFYNNSLVAIASTGMDKKNDKKMNKRKFIYNTSHSFPFPLGENFSASEKKRSVS